MMKFKLALITVAALTAAGCAKKQAPPQLPTAPADTIENNEQPQPGPVSNAVVPGSQADFLASVASDRIFFDTDKTDIDAEDQATLRSQAQWLLRYPQKLVTLEGHADERGTREYNLGLGERRANAAKNYLVGLGIDAGRISVMSFGKERPAALGSDEAAWAQNRRAVTVTVD